MNFQSPQPQGQRSINGIRPSSVNAIPMENQGQNNWGQRLWTSLFGNNDQFYQSPTLNTQQEQGLGRLGNYFQNIGMPTELGKDQSFQSGQNYLQDLYSQSPDGFDRFKAPYLRQFNEQTIPDIAERFSGMGSGQGESSALNQALARAGEGLNTGLASQYEGMRSQNLGQLMQYSQAPMQQFMQLLQSLLSPRTFETQYQPGDLGFVGNAVSGLAQGAGQAGTAALLV